MNIDLNLTPALKKSYGDFHFGDSLEFLCKKIGLNFDEIKNNDKIIDGEWGFNRRKVFLSNDFFETISYMHTALQLVCYKGRLKNIVLGDGWKGNIFGITIGSQLPREIDGMAVIFYDAEDRFFIVDSLGVCIGVAFATNTRASFDCVPDQFVEEVMVW